MTRTQVLENWENSVSSSELTERGKDTVPIGKRVTYALTNKGERLLEICEDISQEEAEEFLRVPPRPLEVLRTIRKEGPKRACDFHPNAYYHLQRMVDRGFLDRVVKRVNAEEVRRMRDEGLLNQEIADKLGVSRATVQYWVKKLNLKRSRSIHRSIWMNRQKRLHWLLEKNGPTPRKDAMETLGLDSPQIKTVLTMFPEEFQRLTFTSGGSRSKMFHELIKAGPVLTLKDDPRIVDFAASKIQLKVETQYDAKSVVDQIKWEIGYHQAREVAERLGYRYKEKPHR